MTTVLSPETVMACAIITAKHTNEPVLIDKVSGLFAKLRQENIEEVGKVALRRRPHGLYSEDVEAFFGRLLAAVVSETFKPPEVKSKGSKSLPKPITDETQHPPQSTAKNSREL